ncbi:MAG: TIGR03885 family FMN-dependent LLM class oxidoreductase [Bacteroidota bacterium]|nr:TIGR03885 family FMN-dependent LLM class oxidoreductase [Bacteroidota bacterium]
MVRVGYHISHEQFPPSELLELAVKAEEAGFDFCLSSDHFHPWSEAQGESGFAWSWLGAAMARTKMEYGIVNCPAYRYHPAIIAQAAATLDEMFPGRFWISIGSGQALNEAITGQRWPEKKERNQRLKECAHIIRELWKGDWCEHDGLVKLEKAKLYTKPATKIRLIAAAITPETAAQVAKWADGLITVSQDIETLKKVVNAWNTNGGAGKPMILKVQLSYDRDREKALEGAHEQWSTNVFGNHMQADLRYPEQFEAAAAYVKPADMEQSVLIGSEAGDFVRPIQEFISLGFKEIVLHNVNRQQEDFIRFFGSEVIENLKH